MIQSEGSIWDFIVVVTIVFLASLLMGWLSARILDVRRGRLRSLAAGVIGFVGGLLLLAVQVQGNVEIDIESDSSAAFLLVLAWLGYALIVALVASLVHAGVGLRRMVEDETELETIFLGLTREVMA